MKKLSETLKELGIAFAFPIEIKDANGKETYFENSDNYWFRKEYDRYGKVTYFEDSDNYWTKREYDSNGKVTYFEDSDNYWYKKEYNSYGNMTYFENSDGDKNGTPRNKTCEGKVIEVDGIKYELKAL